MWPIARSMPAFRQGQPRTNKRKCGTQPANQSLITDVFRSRPHPCTIYRLINFTLARVENVPVVPVVLDKGHQSNRTRRLARAASALGRCCRKSRKLSSSQNLAKAGF